MRSKPWLALILVNDTVKENHLLENFFDALRVQEQNLTGVQLILCNQHRRDDHLRKAASGFSYTMWQCAHDFVLDYPVWNLFRELNRMQSIIRAPYQMVVHKECVFSFGYFEQYRKFLIESNPVIALGNMRRVENALMCRTFWPKSSDPESTEKILESVRGGAEALRRALDTTPTGQWQWWTNVPNFNESWVFLSFWIEDVFCAQTDWLKKLNFFGLLSDLYFQDIYDCMLVTMQVMGSNAPKVAMLNPKIANIFHLAHKKHYIQFTPEFEAYFQHPRWNGSVWQSALYKLVKDNSPDGNARYEFLKMLKNDPEFGTLTRFKARLLEHLAANPMG